MYFRVLNPSDAVVKALDFVRATSLVGQTTLRSILGQSDLDHLLTERDRINQRLQEVIDQQTSAWGVKVTSVEVRDIKLPDTGLWPLVELGQGVLPRIAGGHG